LPLFGDALDALEPVRRVVRVDQSGSEDPCQIEVIGVIGLKRKEKRNRLVQLPQTRAAVTQQDGNAKVIRGFLIPCTELVQRSGKRAFLVESESEVQPQFRVARNLFACSTVLIDSFIAAGQRGEGRAQIGVGCDHFWVRG
jgi:hypothetical protein